MSQDQSTTSAKATHAVNPTVQLLFPMGGLGTRFAKIGIPTPKPLIHVDGAPMILKAISSFEEILSSSFSSTDASSSSSTAAPIDVRVVFVVRAEHEVEFGLRTQLQQAFATTHKGCCKDFYVINAENNGSTEAIALPLPTGQGEVKEEEKGTSSSSPSSSSPSSTNHNRGMSMSVYFVMMHSDTRGAAETCLLAAPALLPWAPVVIMDCDTYVYSSVYNRVLMAMARRAAATVNNKSNNSDNNSTASGEGAAGGDLTTHLRGCLVFFNSKAPRYSFAVVKPVSPSANTGSATNPPLDLADPTGASTTGGRVTQTAEKVPISHCALIGAYAFATGAWFVAAAEKLLAQPINPETGLKEYYISLLYNYLLDPQFTTPSTSTTTTPPPSSDAVLVLAVPKQGYHSFGTPEELDNYVNGRPSYVLE